jgi:hypothetical protein
MSSIEALHQVAPSLQGRRTRSRSVVVETRRRLAQRDPDAHQDALSCTSSCGLEAQPFYDENLTVEEEAPARSSMWLLLSTMVATCAVGAVVALLVN